MSPLAWGSVAFKADSIASALSYYTIFAIPPLCIIIIFVASLVIDRTPFVGTRSENSRCRQKGAEAIESALNATDPHAKGLMASALAIAL